MAHVTTTWTAQESARLAGRAVLDQVLPRHRTDDVLAVNIVGGFAALAMHQAFLQDSRERTHALCTYSVPTQDTPIVLHVRGRVQGQADARQDTFASSANRPDVGTRQRRATEQPFETSVYFSRDPEGQRGVRCHVKVLDLSLPDNLMRVFTFGGAPLRHVAWSAVVVEQLVLAANAEGDGLSAAWMVTRWALLVGIDEVSMEYPHVARPGQDELVAAHVVNAFRGMLPATPPRHFVIDSWLGRLNSASASAAFTYERDLLGRHEQLVTGVAEQWLKDQYAEIAVQLRNILQVLNSQSLPTTRWSDTDVTSSSTAGARTCRPLARQGGFHSGGSHAGGTRGGLCVARPLLSPHPASLAVAPAPVQLVPSCPRG
ncbi:hypothetical protein DMC30DRAFT_283762 [Rhodotorula diobovata]|uniref:Uncharacterized protein n=1 Tax=Rhodotorula diobovata TaxID=5288 RepID=A0A5C5FSR6_9BASI|nr:hypothetical protein DMC30DRAFT_283762 [Rhodotorula diobovata]